MLNCKCVESEAEQLILGELAEDGLAWEERLLGDWEHDARKLKDAQARGIESRVMPLEEQIANLEKVISSVKRRIEVGKRWHRELLELPLCSAGK